MVGHCTFSSVSLRVVVVFSSVLQGFPTVAETGSFSCEVWLPHPGTKIVVVCVEMDYFPMMRSRNERSHWREFCTNSPARWKQDFAAILHRTKKKRKFWNPQCRNEFAHRTALKNQLVSLWTGHCMSCSKVTSIDLHNLCSCSHQTSIMVFDLN